MNRPARDVQRQQVYAAELAAFDGTDLETVIGIDSLREAIFRVCSSAWWPRAHVDVRSTRRDAGSSLTRCTLDDPVTAQIRIARPQATAATAAHELAHVLAGVESGHDSRFRRAHLDVVAAITNLDRLTGRGDLHAEQLRRAYAGAGLDVAARDWTAPPEHGGAIAL